MTSFPPEYVTTPSGDAYKQTNKQINKQTNVPSEDAAKSKTSGYSRTGLEEVMTRLKTMTSTVCIEEV